MWLARLPGRREDPLHPPAGVEMERDHPEDGITDLAERRFVPLRLI
jgi:hypothetical protein